VPNDVSVRVLGAKRLAATLRKAGAEAADMKDASVRVGTMVATAAKARAPVRSGRLQDSIRPARRARGVVIRTGSFRYAWVQEYGSPSRHIRPRAYMRGALEATQSQAIDAYYRELDTIAGRIKGQ
jgi:HK97 gp10 family phage protein